MYKIVFNHIKFLVFYNSLVSYINNSSKANSNLIDVALELWGSWEKLDQEKEDRKIKSAQTKQKRFDKKMQQVRRDIRMKKDLLQNVLKCFKREKYISTFPLQHFFLQNRFCLKY